MTNKLNNFPNLEFEKFFNGKVEAKGNLILRYPKKITKNLHVTFNGVYKNKQLKLNEEYLEDNKKILRSWNFKKISNSLFLGSEENVKGDIIVNIKRNSLLMKYYFKIAVLNFKITVFIRDQMYLINKNEIINTTHVSKFGVKLAEVVLLYKKL